MLKTAPDGEVQPKLKYGFGKLLQRAASDEEVRKRRIKALTYKTVLNGTNRNEIISYQQHGLLAMQRSAFPVYAKGVFVKTRDPNKPDHKGVVVIGADMQLSGKIINLSGRMSDGSETSFGSDASVTNHSPPKTTGSK